MPGLDLLIAFALATATIAFLPGPGTLYTAAQTLSRGRGGGLMAALGLHLGGYVHVTAAALGLSILFRHVPELYLALKLAGAAYLLWLGLNIVRSKALGGELPPVEPKSARRAFVESMSVEILNPKTAVFYVAFLPQFVDPHAALPLSGQFLVFGIVANIAFSSADLLAVLFTHRLLGLMRRSRRAQRLARLAAGSLLIGLGARLALDRT